MKTKERIEKGFCSLGIEFGSTRIKAVLIDEKNDIISKGIYNWKNIKIDGYWSYSEEDILKGLQLCYKNLKSNIYNNYGVILKKFKAIGISAMMHGYLAFDCNDNLLVPFRTWRNNTTKEAASFLSHLFKYNIPQRWSISHYYQAYLNKEKHFYYVSRLNTLSGYIHYRLTGKFVLGICDASGMFPIDTLTCDYNQKMIKEFNSLIPVDDFDLKKRLPTVLKAGQNAGYLTEKGALLLDLDGDLISNIVMCPPEGDAATGMISTNSIKIDTGNVSAGTSVFAMIVLKRQLSKPYENLDLVVSPNGNLVAMVHSNNCTGEYDNWINLFKQVLNLFDYNVDLESLYNTLLERAIVNQEKIGSVLSYNYLSGEHLVDLEEGLPLIIHSPNVKLDIDSFMQSLLYSSLCSLRIGLDELTEGENIKIKELTGHGGFFKSIQVGMKIMSYATNTEINIYKEASEGGAWGIAVLGNFVGENISLEEYLDKKVFLYKSKLKLSPEKEGIKSFNDYLKLFKTYLNVEKSAVNVLKKSVR